MKNSFKSLKRMKVMAFLIIIQLSIGLTMLNSTTAIIEFNQNKVNGFKNLFNFDKTYLIRVINDETAAGIDIGPEKTYEDFDTIENYYNELNILKEKDIIQNNSIYTPAFFRIEEIVNSIPEKYKDAVRINKDLDTPIMVDYNFYNRYNLKISEGRGFSDTDFNLDYKENNIPIILGGEYKENIIIGDTFEKKLSTSKYEYIDTLEVLDYREDSELNGGIIVPDEEVSPNKKGIKKEGGKYLQLIDDLVTFEVIGFYDRNAIPSMISKSSFIQNITYSDLFMVVPTVKGIANLRVAPAIGDLGSFVEVNNEGQLNYLKDILSPRLAEKGLSLRVTPLKDDYLKIKEALVKDVLNSIALGGVLTLLSVIGITCVLLGELNERKKEFGIRIACGASLRTLYKELILEIFLMVSMASIISILSLMIKGAFLKADSIVNLNVILISIGIIFILTLVISLIPIINLRKTSVVEMVRGE